MSIAPIQALAAIGAQTPIDPASGAAVKTQRPAASFGQMMVDGLEQTDSKLTEAERLRTLSALDDSIPMQRVIVAQVEALDSLQLMLQVRARLTEGYQELMRMQL